MFRNIQKLRLVTGLIIGGALVVGSLWFLVPRPEGVEGTMLYSPIGTPLTLIDSAIAIGGAVLFLLALRNFKKELKPAYRYIAYAQAVVGVSWLIYPYIEYYNLWTNVWLNMSSYLGYFIGSILFYFGARKFYQLLGLRSFAGNAWIVLAITLIAWGLHVFLPRNGVGELLGYSDLDYNLFALVPLTPVLVYGAAIYLFMHIRRKTGEAYHKALTWLLIGLGLQFLSALGVAILEVINYDNWYFASRAYVLPTILGDMGLLIAAYQFNAIGLPYHPGILHRLPADSGRAISSIDIILYVAGKVSDPSKIDRQLDGMRKITATLSPGQGGYVLNEQEQQTLYKVYTDIERHLLQSDDFKQYDKDTLRNDVRVRFALDSEKAVATFWPLLDANASLKQDSPPPASTRPLS